MAQDEPDVNHRRMREILQFLREQHPEQSLANHIGNVQIPPDNNQIHWDSSLLEHLDLLTHALDLKGGPSDIGPPTFEIPNNERRSLVEYYDAEIWAEDEFFEDDINVEFDFNDPYPNLPPWNGPNSSDYREDNIENPTQIPTPYVTQDGEMTSGIPRQMNELEGMEAWAWYSPMGVSHNPWGIYVQRKAPAAIAEIFFRDMDSRYEAWCLASRLLLHHEYFHFLSQYHCDSSSFSQPKEMKYNRYNAWCHQNQMDAREEAVANAYAFEKEELHMSKNKDERKLVDGWFSKQPRPYRDYVDFYRKMDLGYFSVAYQQESPIGSMSISPNLMVARRYKQKPLFPVPVYFVDDAKPEFNAPKMVTFSSITYSPKVARTRSKGKIPSWVFEKTDELIQLIQGKSIDKLNKLHRMNSKTHWKQNISGYRAIWTQVKNYNGWMIIFVGTHKEYDTYQARHKL
jgi:hypothetical protein